MAQPPKRKLKGMIGPLIGLALMIAIVAGLLLSLPRIRTFTSLGDYSRIRDALAANPAVATFPPSGTAFPPGSDFHARIVPMQGMDHLWLFIPGTRPVPPGQASDQQLSDLMRSEARAALDAMAPGRDPDTDSTSITLLFQDLSSFSLLWQDHTTGDCLYIALLD